MKYKCPTNTWKMSTSLVIRKMQIQTPLRFHLILVRMKIFKETDNSKCWLGCEEMGVLVLSPWWECQMAQPPQKSGWWFFKKLKLPYDRAEPLLGVCQWMSGWQKWGTPTRSFIHITSGCLSVDEWMAWMRYTSKDLYSSTTKNEMSFPRKQM